ncbi:hypothetical protein SAMN04490369_101426 [Vreelandella aquamarina]|jgi:hypothetical protein|uniref:Uncharacterized protein n=1 Tax=Vreelandella aquamarina TaxID=77097 RepID=A0A1H8H6I6_9GAMM|nr:hypothetical protein SAMN04490369_101426 [Halomonas aquamarina]
MTQDIALLRLQEAWRECQRHMHFINQREKPLTFSERMDSAASAGCPC